MRAFLIFVFALVVGGFAPARAQGDPLDALVEVLRKTDDAQLQQDILKGVSEALKGKRSAPMPAGWSEVETKLAKSKNAEVRTMTQSLALTFGSQNALAALRKTALDSKAEVPARRAAVTALLGARDAELPPLLRKLVAEQTLRADAIRGLAAFDDPAAAETILALYAKLSPTEKRDALNTLASRVSYAKPLLAAIEAKKIAATDLTAELVRQVRNLKNAELDAQIQKAWGAFREASPDKQAEIEKYRKIYRAGGSTPGDASRGRAVYAKTCQQCHMLFDVGGKVGPDLTGSARGDLNYILENMVDPNAVIPNDYRTSTIETKDDRVLTGIVKQQDDKSITVATANETVVIPRNEIASMHLSEISMMPEGLLTPLTEQEVRDLIYYLGRPGQVPLPAGAAQ